MDKTKKHKGKKFEKVNIGDRTQRDRWANKRPRIKKAVILTVN